jgi:hypothetical protein
MDSAASSSRGPSLGSKSPRCSFAQACISSIEVSLWSEGIKPSTEDLLDRGRVGTGQAMVVKVGFRNFPYALKVLGPERLLKSFVHNEMPFV